MKTFLTINPTENLIIHYIGSQAPSSPWVGMMWLDTGTSPATLKYWNNSSWVAVNADTIDGYHASQTPAANTIPITDGEGAFVGWMCKNTYEKLQILSISGGQVNWDLNNGGIAKLTLTSNVTVNNPSNMRAGGIYVLILQQDSTGGRTVTWGSVYRWPGGTAPVLSTGANKVDIVTFICDGTYMYGAALTGF